MSNPVMPKELQVITLKRIFKNLNPEADPEVIDWVYEIDSTLTMPENRLELSIKFPIYKWFKDETELKSTKEETIKELEDMLSYMLTVVPEEAKEDFQKLFDDYISKVRYSLERKLKIAPLKREVVELRAKLEEAQRKRETPKPPPEIKKVAWTPRLEQRLKDTFEAMLRRERLSPARFWAEYRLELEVIKALETEEIMLKAVEELAKEIIERERIAPPIRPPIEAIPRPPRPPIIPPEEEEEERIPMVITPAFPPKPLSKLPFPRNLSIAEKDQIWRAFMDELTMRGIDPSPHRRKFDNYLGTFQFKNWQEVREHFERALDLIITGREELFPLYKVILPWKTLEEAIVHLTATKLYKNVDDLLNALYAYGLSAEREDVVKTIKEAWKRKDLMFTIVTKDFLEELIGGRLE